MYYDNMSGLGKFKFKKIFKKATKALMKHPLAPLPIKAMAMKKMKKKKTIAVSPSPAVEQSYEQEPQFTTMPVQPMPSYSQPQPVPYPQPMPSYSQPQPVPYPQPMEPVQDYLPQDIFNAARSFAPEPSPSMYPFDYVPEETETGTENLPVVRANEFEEMYDGEQAYLEGLAQGSSWGDIFTGAASEILASQRAKREAKAEAARQAQYSQYKTTSMPSVGGFSLEKMMIPLAIAAGGLFLLMRKKRG